MMLQIYACIFALVLQIVDSTLIDMDFEYGFCIWDIKYEF